MNAEDQRAKLVRLRENYIAAAHSPVIRQDTYGVHYADVHSNPSDPLHRSTLALMDAMIVLCDLISSGRNGQEH